jgi:hypothetical protein
MVSLAKPHEQTRCAMANNRFRGAYKQNRRRRYAAKRIALA